MSLTGQLGTPLSQLGNILLGASGVPPSLQGTVSGSATCTGLLQRPDKFVQGIASGSATCTGLLTKPPRLAVGIVSGSATIVGTLTGGHPALIFVPPALGGWGDSAWGGDAWGGGGTSIAGFGLVNAVAVAENVVRLEFTQPVYFSGYLDAQDASNPRKYTARAIGGTVGYDGENARAVNAAGVQLSPVVAGFGRFLDVYLDRAMTPYPAQYAIDIANTLVSANSKEALDSASPLTITFFGLFRKLVPPTFDTAIPSRDIANPQTFASNDTSADQTWVLGTYHVDETGDYASDSGLPNLKKRIYRRLMTRKGAFAHMPDYGVGVADEGKRLNTATVQQRIIAEAERQILQEPDVDRVRVSILIDRNEPSLVRFIVLVKTKAGQKDKFEIPLKRAA